MCSHTHCVLIYNVPNINTYIHTHTHIHTHIHTTYMQAHNYMLCTYYAHSPSRALSLTITLVPLSHTPWFCTQENPAQSVMRDAIQEVHTHARARAHTRTLWSFKYKHWITCSATIHTHTHTHTHTNTHSLTHSHTHTHMCVCVYRAAQQGAKGSNESRVKPEPQPLNSKP